METKKYAFWQYDKFPYTLSGVIGKPANKHPNKDLVFIPSYASFFAPFAIVEGDEGKRLHEDLKKLDSEYLAAEKILAKRYNAKLFGRLGQSSVKHPKEQAP